ncbi:MAG: hypothetical protein LBO67_00670 [Spirochaetaceae bacterium]|jgi:YbbR domain-containing protein|nr:hypothetical protein [Spirochaetaceae bacterium]
MNIKDIDTKALLNTITENWIVKVLCIALAIVLFIFHEVGSLGERFFSIPLIIETREGMIPASSYPHVVRITVRGDMTKIGILIEDDIEAYLDLTKHSQAGFYKVPVQVRKRGNAIGLAPLEINVEPMMVNIDLDYNVSKMVPISANLEGTVAEGYELIAYSLNPMQVQVYGPARIIRNLTSLSTESIALEGRTEDFSIMTAILNRDPLLVIQRDTFVEFRCSIQKRGSVSRFDVPITITRLNTQFTATMDISAAQVEFEGSRQDLEQWKAPPRFLVADCVTITKPGTYTVRLSIPQPPSQLKLLHIEPEAVTLVVHTPEPEPAEQTPEDFE